METPIWEDDHILYEIPANNYLWEDALFHGITHVFCGKKDKDETTMGK